MMHKIKKRYWDLVESLKAWWFRRRITKFEKFVFPVIKNMNTDWDIREIMSVQPMDAPSKNFFTEYCDLGDPRIGQTFHDGLKDPDNCHCCLRSMWYKIWTPMGWVCEKTDSKAYREAVDKYEPIYKAQVANEREAWNKEHGITPEDFHIPTKFIFNSKKSL